MNALGSPDFRGTVRGPRLWIWPDISDADSARGAAKQGAIAALCCGALTLLNVLLAVLGVKAIKDLGIDAWATVDAVVFFAIAWGIFRLNRAAAVIGLSLYLIERLAAFKFIGGGAFVLMVIFTLAFVNGVRGTFAFKRLAAAPTPECPSQSSPA